MTASESDGSHPGPRATESRRNPRHGQNARPHQPHQPQQAQQAKPASDTGSRRRRSRGGKRHAAPGGTLGRGLELSAIAIPFLTVIAAAAFAYLARPILIPLTTALMLAYVLAPGVELLARWHLPRGLSVVVVLSLAVGILGGIGFLVIDQAQALVRALPSYWHNLQLRLGSIDQWIDKLPEPLQEMLPQTKSDIWNQLAQFDFGGATATVFSGLGSVVVYLGWSILITFLTLFMLIDMPNLRDRLVRALGRKNEPEIRATIASINAQLRGYLTVKLATSAGLGLVATIGLLLLDVPYAYVWGPLIGILNIIPYIGSLISAIPPIVITMIHHNSIMSGVWVLVLILVLQQIESNLITPKLIGDKISINVVAVLVSTVVWGWLWGPFGILLAIPMTAGIKVICERIEPLRPIAAMLG